MQTAGSMRMSDRHYHPEPAARKQKKAGVAANHHDFLWLSMEGQRDDRKRSEQGLGGCSRIVGSLQDERSKVGCRRSFYMKTTRNLAGRGVSTDAPVSRLQVSSNI